MACSSGTLHRRNKWITGALAVTVFLICSGCGEEKIPFAYNPDYEVSSFRVVNENASVTADAFAMELCVADGDVNVNDEVLDMSGATAAGLFDLNDHSVLYAKNIHTRLDPASLTKLMTAVVALKYGNPDDMITATSNVVITESGATLCGLAEGDQLTLNQALHALLMKSANDAAVVIAEHISGSVEAFAELMNEEAKAIGATNSHFVNPHGLTAENHYVTAYDMYLIFNEAIKYDLVTEIISMNSYDSVYKDKNGNSKQLSLKSTNWYLTGNATAPDQVNVVGGKTGTTNAAKNCLVLLARDTASNPYIAVILRSEERQLLYTEMTDLLDEIN